ncbi:MAG: hypothetical protein QF570_15470 [Myxococcota bacterium]|jgi:hypothetical protein|nr:hypothetical protein [Myxococcota bacterium]
MDAITTKSEIPTSQGNEAGVAGGLKSGGNMQKIQFKERNTNHDLWTRPLRSGLRGRHKYDRLVEICQDRGVHTPEDPFVLWEGDGGMMMTEIPAAVVLHDAIGGTP